jgi:hypothetical protein
MSRSVLWIVSSLLLGCGAVESIDSVDSVEEGLTAVWSADFESAPLGASPWFTSGGGASSVSVVATTDHGHALKLHGSPTLGDFIIAAQDHPPIARDFTTRFDVKPAAGASPTFIQRGTGSGYSRQQLRLFRAPGSDTLWASSALGNTACGTLKSGVWSQITLRVRFSTATFDVAINGVTACSGLSTRLGAPATGVSVMDPSNEGYGGDTLFDNFAGY